MVFEQIEKLKREYTDKYVVIDDSRPELRRFAGRTGTVRTVNMSGRALVEFDGGDNNIGWFDIDIDYLKVIDQPLPKPEKKAEAPKTAAKTADKPADKPKGGGSVADILAAARSADKGGAAQKPAAEKSAPSAGKLSTDDILAAARGKTSPAEKKTPASTADILAAARSEKSAPAAEKPKPSDASKLSTADILAAARTKKTPAAKAPAEPEPEPPAGEEEPVAEQAAEPAAAPAGGITPKDQLPQDVPGILAFCRRVDTAE